MIPLVIAHVHIHNSSQCNSHALCDPYTLARWYARQREAESQAKKAQAEKERAAKVAKAHQEAEAKRAREEAARREAEAVIAAKAEKELLAE